MTTGTVEMVTWSITSASSPCRIATPPRGARDERRIYFGVRFNESRLNHFYQAYLDALFKWLNRRSQKRSLNWKRFRRRLLHQPLPRPLHGHALIDGDLRTPYLTKHQPKSRMRENRTSGSERSASW